MIIMRIVRTNWGWITASPGPGDSGSPPTAPPNPQRIHAAQSRRATDGGVQFRASVANTPAEYTGAAVILGATFHCPLPNWKSGLTF
jgi:hypothetical protein